MKFEEMESGQAVDEVMALLRKIFEPRGTTVPPPLEVLTTLMLIMLEVYWWSGL